MKNILTEIIDNNILFITINRPKALNALSLETLGELDAVLDQNRDNRSIKAVIITGAGDKAFVAGADVTEFESVNESNAIQIAKSGHEIFFKIALYNKPVIALVNGYALGGGCELAIACHLRLASPKAKFGQPEVNLGLTPGYGATQRLKNIIGKGRAFELMMTCDQIDAITAYNWGLINKVIEGDLLEGAIEFTRKITSKSTSAIQAVIKATNSSQYSDYDLEAQVFGESIASEDFKEGYTAFIEKRKPNFGS